MTKYAFLLSLCILHSQHDAFKRLHKSLAQRWAPPLSWDEIALNRAIHKTSQVKVWCSTNQRLIIETKRYALQSRKKHRGSDCSQVPSSHLLATSPGVAYQSDTICRCGEPPCWQAEEGSEAGGSIVAPLIILPDSATPSQASRTQTWNIHNSFIPHTQRSLQEVLWEKQLDCQGLFPSTINSILRSHRNYYLHVFIFIVHFQKKLVSLGPTLFRTLRTLQKARTSNSSFWQGSATGVYLYVGG